jgi:hypothetical protein
LIVYLCLPHSWDHKPAISLRACLLTLGFANFLPELARTTILSMSDSWVAWIIATEPLCLTCAAFWLSIISKDFSEITSNWFVINLCGTLTNFRLIRCLIVIYLWFHLFCVRKNILYVSSLWNFLRFIAWSSKLFTLQTIQSQKVWMQYSFPCGFLQTYARLIWWEWCSNFIDL